MTLSVLLNLIGLIIISFLYFRYSRILYELKEKITENRGDVFKELYNLDVKLEKLHRKIDGPSHHDLYQAALSKIQKESESRIIVESGIKPEDLK